jgi:NAD(P)H dehydrogenase (quinone)
MSIRLAIVYYSTYGTNYRMAQVAAEAAEEAGAEVRLLKARETAPQEVIDGQEKWAAQAKLTADVPEATPHDLDWADAMLFSAPTRYGGASSQMRAFIDTLGPLWQKGGLLNKTVTALTSASNPHGGQETTLLSLYTTFMHWGAILVPPGYSDDVIYRSGGNPYGTSVTATEDAPSEEEKASIRHQTHRLIEITERLVAKAPREQSGKRSWKRPAGAGSR